MFHGFIFIRFKPGPQPSLATLLAPLKADFEAYDVKSVVPVFVPDWSTDLPVNWKSVRDVDNEGYHVPLAHPGLQDLYGRTYVDGFMERGLSMSIGWFGDVPAKGWSVRHYNKISPPRPDLPQHLQKAWLYFGIFPATVFTFTPEGMQVYYDIPLTEGTTRVTGRVYRWPNETREAKVARYLAYRIDRATSAADQQLSIWSNESMKSDAFEGFHLSDLEYGVRRHHDSLRRLLPVLTLDQAPSEDQITCVNAEMTCQTKGQG
jgi:phenylpropionate dioxygenase-like ring-hydroxylating dioxygenase large terminal subunit